VYNDAQMYLLCLETDYFSSMSYFINLFYLNSSKSYSNKTMLLLGWSNRYTNSRSLRTGWSLWNIHFSNGNGSLHVYVNMFLQETWLYEYHGGFLIRNKDCVPVASPRVHPWDLVGTVLLILLFCFMCCVFCFACLPFFVLCQMLHVSPGCIFLIAPFSNECFWSFKDIANAD